MCVSEIRLLVQLKQTKQNVYFIFPLWYEIRNEEVSQFLQGRKELKIAGT